MPAVAVIGGSGLGQFEGLSVLEETCPETPYGEISAPLQIGRYRETELVFLARHGRPHRIPPHRVNYRANIWALHSLGVKSVLAVNAVGGIAAGVQSGAMVIPDQLIDYSYGRPHTFADAFSDVPLHIDFTHPYSTGLRRLLLAGATSLGLPVVPAAVYACTQGPRLESAAEINRLERDGCDIVGMTGMPEAALARELGLAYASVCLVVNPAAGRGPGEITLADIEKVMAEGMGRVRKLLLHCVDAAL